jgi:hypothetical protein
MGRVRDASIDFAPVCPYPEGQAWIKIEHDEIIAGCHEWKVESISGSVGGAVSG